MSKRFRKFVQKTNKLEFYNPKSAINSISRIQRHLNNEMKFKSNPKQNNIKQISSKQSNNNFIKIYKHIANLINKNKNPITAKNDEEKMEKKQFRKIIKFNNHQNLSYNHNTNEKNNSQITTPHSLSFNEIKGRSYRKIKYYSIKPSNKLEKDFERKNLDKYLMTKSYLDKYSYYSTLSDKELKFQKDLLFHKFNNSLYRVKNSVELKDGIIGKDSLENFSLIIDERAKQKAKSIADKYLLDIDLIKGSFSTNQNKFSLNMKSAMSTVINRYIRQNKLKPRKKSLLNLEGIKKNNEKKILYLTDSVNNINHNISETERLIKKIK